MPCQYPITKEFLGQVAQLSTLQDLDLSATYPAELPAPGGQMRQPIKDLRPLSALTGLTSLGLACMGIQKPGLDAISCLKSLRSLKLGGGRFTNKGLRVLTGLTSLRSLSLVNCYNITDKGFKALVAPLSKQSLAQVDVRGCGLTDLSLAVNMGVDNCQISGFHPPLPFS
ncbi:g11394 [Coccomyxa viridis]|uniref:G11394 protein n=1 Tax=Coccomyxa viridis TaxID=1274662 RepID=A0ABP1G802_9CHLO